MFDLRFTNGYKTALRHVIQWFESHDDYLRWTKLRTHKGYKLMLKKLYENADRFMEEGEMLNFYTEIEEIQKAGSKLLLPQKGTGV